MSALAIKPTAHIVDILGNVIGRDQPILRMEKALEIVSLLGEDIFTDDNVVFFDPFCKAGELLLACAFQSCFAKAKGKSRLLDVDLVIKEVYQSNRYFGLAPDERHHRLSTRTFLGNVHSHNESFNHIIRDGHYLSEEDGKLDQQKFEKEFSSMIDYINSKARNKKIVAIGNPPYQESDGGGGQESASLPVYNIFVEKLISSGAISEFSLVIPARWFAGGRNLDDFRSFLVESKQIKSIRYFERAEDVFPTVHVQGGVCFLNWSSTYRGNTRFITKAGEFDLDLSKYDIIPDDPECYSILDKVLEHTEGFVADIAWTGKPFGLRTFHFSRFGEAPANDPTAILCYSKGKKLKRVRRSEVTKNADKIDQWKVATPATYATGARRCTLPKHQFFMVKRGEVITETYNIVGSFGTKAEAENFIKYLQTDFARYMLGLRKLTGRVTKETWAWIPLISLEREWTDKSLADLFSLTKNEQEHIKKKVQEWS